jgi:hypothetical protein
MSRAQHQRLLERVRGIEEVAPGHHQGAWRVDSKGHPRRRRFTGGEFPVGAAPWSRRRWRPEELVFGWRAIGVQLPCRPPPSGAGRRRRPRQSRVLYRRVGD